MTNKESQLFEEVKVCLANEYNLVYKNPYGDDYFTIVKSNGDEINGFNPKGRNLLTCLYLLSKAIKDEMN